MTSKYLNPRHLRFRLRHAFGKRHSLQVNAPDFCWTYEEYGVEARKAHWDSPSKGECIEITTFTRHYGPDDNEFSQKISMSEAFELGQWLITTAKHHRPSLPKRMWGRIRGCDYEW